MIRPLLVALVLATCFAGQTALGYPLDLYKETGMRRLEAYYLIHEYSPDQGFLKPGALLSGSFVKLSMVDDPDFVIPEPDVEFSAKLKEILGGDARAYGIALLDITDPSNPRYAAVNDDRPQQPGSVGKIMVALGLFQTLADLHPDDWNARAQVLKNTEITANEFIIKDTHVVPVWEDGKLAYRPIEIGDTANMWTWMDWMLSASSNAAAAEMQSQVMLLKKFGTTYPVSVAKSKAYFADTSKRDLVRSFDEIMIGSAKRNGIDTGALRQGSFFTRTGKTIVPAGGGSTSTARELLHYMLLMEQGKLVDEPSSLEIKRLLYLTDRRIRYASQPVLDSEAVYYKSGSFYSCRPKSCPEKYEGTTFNYMNSVAMIEHPDVERPVRYVVAVLSNVLGKNSVNEHRELARRIHEVLMAENPPSLPWKRPGFVDPMRVPDPLQDATEVAPEATSTY